jgi:hypothetical protein
MKPVCPPKQKYGLQKIRNSSARRKNPGDRNGKLFKNCQRIHEIVYIDLNIYNELREHFDELLREKRSSDKSGELPGKKETSPKYADVPVS